MPRIYPSKASRGDQTTNESKQKKTTDNTDDKNEENTTNPTTTAVNDTNEDKDNMNVDDNEVNDENKDTSNNKNDEENGDKQKKNAKAKKNVQRPSSNTTKPKSTIKLTDSTTAHSRRILTPKKVPSIARVTKGRSIEFSSKNGKVTGWIKDQTDNKMLIRWSFLENNNVHFKEQWFNKNDKNLHVFDRRFDVQTN